MLLEEGQARWIAFHFCRMLLPECWLAHWKWEGPDEQAGCRCWLSSQSLHSSWAGPEGGSLAREGGSVWFWVLCCLSTQLCHSPDVTPSGQYLGL